MIGDETPAERAHPSLANLCIDLRALKVPCDGWSPAADAVGEIKRLRSQLSQVTRERDEAREEAARVRLLGESDSRELLKAETSRDAAEATLREAREAFGVFIVLHLVSHGLPQVWETIGRLLDELDERDALERRAQAAESERDEARARLEQARAAEEKQDKRERVLRAATALLAAAPDRRLFTTSLNKALFYLDLVHLRDTGDTLTHSAFIALPQGPVLAHYKERLVDELESSGLAKQVRGGRGLPLALTEEGAACSIADDLRARARKIAEWAASMSAEDVSDLSHENIGWRLAKAKGDQLRRPQAIDLNIAMQQVMGDADPWMERDDPAFVKLAADEDESTVPWE